jgi:hypothetical protein
MLVWGYMQALGEPLRDLPGGSALAPLYLLDGVFRAAYTLRQVELCEVELFAALPEPATKRELFFHRAL